MAGAQDKAVVLVSGGMDSCVCAAIACKQHGAANIALLHASYGQRTESREARAFREIADFYAVTRRLMVRLDHFRAIGGSALTDDRISVPGKKLCAPELHGSEIPVTDVPFRNAHFLSVVVSCPETISPGQFLIGPRAENN